MMLDRRVKSKGEAFMIPPASSSICPTLPKVDRHYVSSPQSWPWLCKSVRITCFKGTLRGTKKGQARRTFSQVKAQHPCWSFSALECGQNMAELIFSVTATAHVFCSARVLVFSMYRDSYTSI